MQFKNPFQTKGRWLKGNTHTHTVNSDGTWTTTAMAQAYGAGGYDFVFLTDHQKRTIPPPQDHGPLLIPAEEIHFGINRRYGYHVVCLGIKRQIEKRHYRSMTQFMQFARREGFLPIIAHPHWCGTPSHCLLRTASHFWAIEIFNTICHCLNGKGYATVHWDDLLDSGRRVLGLAADDSHRPTEPFMGGWIMVKAKARTESAIVAAIRQGCFYSTQGPEIKDITLTGQTLQVRCSPVQRIHFISNRSLGGTRLAEMERVRHLTVARWDIKPACKYVRIECVDGNGKTAWSNPFYFS